MKFDSDTKGREFDAVSNKTIAQTTKATKNSARFKRQVKSTFQAAKTTGRNAAFQFTNKNGKPSASQFKTLQETAKEFESGFEIISP